MIKVVVNPQFESLNSFAKYIPVNFPFQGEPFYIDRNELKCYKVDDYNLIVKRYRKPHFINRIIYTYWRPSKAKRAYKFALKLLSLGLNSPAPIAYIEQYKFKLLTYGYFISIFENEFTNIRDLMDGTQDDDLLLNELAIYIGKLHDKGVLHLDLSPGNVMYKKTTDGVQFTLIDINRMQFFESISKENRFKNFKRITENTTVLKKLAAYYSLAANYNETECVDKIVKYSTQFFIARNRKYNEV